jgi:uncharacterized membrane protein YdjX (TVP38/TMEM64 family)
VDVNGLSFQDKVTMVNSPDMADNHFSDSDVSVELQPSLDSTIIAEVEQIEGLVLRRPNQTQSFQSQSPSRSGTVLKTAVGCALFSCMIFVIVDSLRDRNIVAALLHFLEWVHKHPWQGTVLVSICYIFATILFVPGSILTLGAGFAIGSSFQNTAVGVIIATSAVFVGASIGSICSFLLGRYLFRGCVVTMAESYPLLQAIDAALGHNGFKIMILLRLSPLIPFNVLDYTSGVSSISLRDYSLALVALLPGAFMLSFVGAGASSLSESTTSGNQTLKVISIVSGVLFGGCGVYAASYYSKLELDKILQQRHAMTFPSPAGSDDSDEVLLSNNGL